MEIFLDTRRKQKRPDWKKDKDQTELRETNDTLRNATYGAEGTTDRLPHGHHASLA